MMREYVWRWELTPLEAYKGQTYWIPPGAKPVTLEVSRFKAVAPASLEGELAVQFGVSDKSFTRDIQDMRKVQPGLPVTGDRRSGVIILEKEKIVGSYVMDGSRYVEQHRIVVHPDYRGRRLSTKLVLEWYKHTKRPIDLAPQRLNPYSARAFLSGQRAVYEWAVYAGKNVPDKVRREMETGEETGRILEALDRVLKTRQPVTLC